MRIAEIYEIFGAVNLTIMVLMPLTTGARHLPFIFWLPFDPLTSSFRYYFSYVYQAMCAIIAGGINLSANMFIFYVLICLNFNFALLSERIQHIGYNDLNANGLQSQMEYYKDIIDHINIHLKINR